MSEHYTKLTVSAMHHCGPCGKQTEHRVDKGRLGPCLRCCEKLQVESAINEMERRRRARQGSLFLEAQ